MVAAEKERDCSKQDLVLAEEAFRSEKDTDTEVCKGQLSDLNGLQNELSQKALDNKGLMDSLEALKGQLSALNTELEAEKLEKSNLKADLLEKSEKLRLLEESCSLNLQQIEAQKTDLLNLRVKNEAFEDLKVKNLEMEVELEDKNNQLEAVFQQRSEEIEASLKTKCETIDASLQLRSELQKAKEAMSKEKADLAAVLSSEREKMTIRYTDMEKEVTKAKETVEAHQKLKLDYETMEMSLEATVASNTALREELSVNNSSQDQKSEKVALENAGLASKIDELDHEKNLLNEKIKELENSTQHEREAMNILKVSLSEAELAKDQFHKDKIEAENQLAAKNETIETLESKNCRLEEEYYENRESFEAESAKKRAVLEAEIDELTKCLSTLESGKTSEITELKESLETLNHKLDEKAVNIKELESEITLHKQDIYERSNSLQNFQVENDAMKGEKETLHAQLQSLENEKHVFEEKLATSENANANLEREVGETKEKCMNLHQEVLCLKTEKEGFMACNLSLEQEKSVLMEKQGSLKAEADSLKALMDSTDAQFNQLLNETENLREIKDNLKQELDNLENKMDDKELAFVEIKALLEQERGFHKGKEDEIKAAMTTFSNEQEVKNEIIKNLENEKQELIEKLSRSEVEVSTFKSEVVVKEDKLHVMLKETENLRQVQEDLSSRLEKSDKKLADKEEAFNETNNLLESLKENEAVILVELSEIKSDMNIKAERIKALDLDNRTLQKELSDCQETIQSLENEKKFSVQKVAELQNEVSSCQNSLNEMEKMLSSKSEHVSKLEDKLVEVNESLESQILDKISAEEEMEKVNAELENIRQTVGNQESQIGDLNTKLRELEDHKKKLIQSQEDIKQSTKVEKEKMAAEQGNSYFTVQVLDALF